MERNIKQNKNVKESIERKHRYQTKYKEKIEKNLFFEEGRSLAI